MFLLVFNLQRNIILPAVWRVIHDLSCGGSLPLGLSLGQDFNGLLAHEVANAQVRTELDNDGLGDFFILAGFKGDLEPLGVLFDEDFKGRHCWELN
jgi:hypothetical protein